MPALTVNTHELKMALARLKENARCKQAKKVLFFCKNNRLGIFFGGYTVEVAAVGTFAGRAEVVGSEILNRVAAPTNEVRIIRLPKGIQVGMNEYPCVWFDWPRPIPLSTSPTLAQILGARLRYLEDEIDNAGLAGRLENTKKECKDRIDKAFQVLGSLNVEWDEISKMVDQAVWDSTVKDFPEL